MEEPNNINDRLLLRLLTLKKEKGSLSVGEGFKYRRLKRRYEHSQTVYNSILYRRCLDRGYSTITNAVHFQNSEGNYELKDDGSGPSREIISEAGKAAIWNGELISETVERSRTKMTAVLALVISALAIIISLFK